MTDALEIRTQKYENALEPKQYKLCACHPPAGRHRFGKKLACVREGCPVNWHQYQIAQRECEGGNVPVNLRGKRGI